MTQRQRIQTVKVIAAEVERLWKFHDGLKDDNPIRQEAIDNDLKVIAERLREINSVTRVDSMAMNATRKESK
jgi:hypothetical protein